MRTNSTSLNHNTQAEKKQSSFCRSHQSNYTVIPNALLCDSTISLQAKGLLCYLLHLPMDWVVYHKQLMKQHKIGECALNTILKELLKSGYMRRERAKIGTGKFAPYQYEFSDEKRFKTERVSNNNNRTGFSGPDDQALLSTKPTNLSPKGEIKKKTTTKTNIVARPRPLSTSSVVAFPEKKKEPDKPKVYKCLEPLAIPLAEKEIITKRNTEAMVEKSVAWATNPSTTPRKSIVASLKWFLALSEDKQPKTSLDKEQDIKENKALAKYAAKNCHSQHTTISVLSNSVYLEHSGAAGTYLEIPYSIENFSLVLQKAMEARGFKRIKKN